MGKAKPLTDIMTLSPQEYAVLQYLWNGLQRKEIAEVMQLSECTVHNYTHTMYHKLGVNTSMRAVRKALQLGLLSV